MAAFQSIDLFGGAVKAQYPKNFIDASELRQIPDHQEVYLESDGFTNIVVEFLERPPDLKCPTDVDAALFHLSDISEDDELLETDVRSKDTIQFQKASNLAAVSIIALNASSSSREASLEERVQSTLIRLLLLRAKNATDILITINIPLTSEHGFGNDGKLDQALIEQATSKADNIAQKISETFEIVDESLFAG
ncbi:MAG: multicopy suppressor of ts gsp1 [Bogoriella megaspora]|nr:MAG: multicopy suppressor of ts gsp1 [Bogoriella megaspora]